MLLNNLPQAKRAAYDTKSRAGRRSCTAKTREKILADLVAWAADAEDTHVYWLNGMAGTGKTTIAFTFSQILDNIDVLGASFFCSHLDADLSNADLIFPTLAYELARHSTAASKALLNALEKDRNVAHKSVRDQFLNLIVTPTKVASEGVSMPRPLVIVIDALDECADQNDVTDVLAIICQYSPFLPLKFFITSRPERQIQNVFRQEGTSRYSKFILHEIEKDIVSADIAIYAREELAIIASGRMPISGWPPEDCLNILVRLSGTLFIYAATACKYIGGGGSIVERLEDVTTDVSPNSPNNETSALDDLYGHILSVAFERANAREKDEMKKVLRAVISIRSPLSINSLSNLLKIKAENVSEALSSFHSVVYIPENMGLPISTFHDSFNDFITTEKRSGEHFLEPSISHHMLGLHCIGLLQSSLMENICQFEEFSVLNEDVSPSAFKDQISEVLEYACINWAFHVSNIKSEGEGGEVTREVWEALYSFFNEKLLQWFECLSLLTRLGDAVSSLQKLEAWVPVCVYSIFMRIQLSKKKVQHKFLNAVVDARRFIMENFDLVSHHPHETYSSALVWLPEKSCIRTKYGDKRKNVWKVAIGMRNAWDACEQVLWGHSDWVHSAIFSPDGSHVVSGSMDNTVRIWNVATGESKAELRGHSGGVNSVIFSPDGSHIVSGSDDNTMRIWSVTTGESKAELRGHKGSVNSVVFSSDGSHIVSGSDDGTVHIWNLETGESEAELKGHSGSVYSAIFSPDGNRVVSGSFDNTIRIWNVTSGSSEAELKGHSGSVYSVVFSPDGSLVVSGSFDSTVRIWNVATGKSEAELRGHLGSVNSVVFSPDGSRVASGSFDNTVRIWNMATRDFEAELRGHSGCVVSVIFSLDGSRVVSGSDDSTVRIWNVATAESEAELRGHSGTVYSVVFSPDGSRVVSGSFDNTVRIWNVAMGESKAELKGHSNVVDSIVLTPDGRHVVSGSFDNTMRIWNVATGASEAVLKGHLGIIDFVIFSPDGSYAVSVSDNSTMHIWNVSMGESAELRGHSDTINSATFSPDGSHVASGSDDGTVHIWNVATRDSEVELKGHLGSVNSVAFSPDGRHVVSGSCDNNVHIWNVATGVSEANLRGHSDSVNFVIFSPDGNCVVSRSADNTVRIWNIATGFSSVIADAVLQDRIYFHNHLRGFHISLPLFSKGMSSFHLDSPWIVHTKSGLKCWLPPQYRDIQTITSHDSLFCIGLKSGLVLAARFSCSDPLKVVPTFT